MVANKFISIVRKYKKCPNCGESWKGEALQVQLEGEVVEITCICGFFKRVDENNKEIS